MNEDDIIKSLADDFLNDDKEIVTGEPNAEEKTETKNGEGRESLEQDANNNHKFDSSAIQSLIEENNKKIFEAINDLKSSLNQKATTEQTDEEKILLKEMTNKLGIDSINKQMQDVLSQLLEHKRQETFNSEWNKFSKEFPEISQDELYKWAIDNDIKEKLTTADGWRTIVKFMRNQTKTKDLPDNITGSASGVKQSSFDKIKKGEAVSDIEIGQSILDMIK
jgi:hypothetical protein